MFGIYALKMTHVVIDYLTNRFSHTLVHYIMEALRGTWAKKKKNLVILWWVFSPVFMTEERVKNKVLAFNIAC